MVRVRVVKFSISHVLVIDEHPEHRRGIAALCRADPSSAIAAIEASSMAEAQEIIDRRRIDAVLLDLDTGRLDELELDALPVIALGGRSTDAPDMIAAGAQDYLDKHALDAQLLSRAIRYAIERHGLVKALRRASLTDELTGLHNRRGFFLLAQQLLESSRRSGESLVILFIDVDGLKQTNDTHGHDAGDALLMKTATVMRRTFRGADVIARIGGDEFAVLAQAQDAARVEDRLLRNAEGHVGLSLGSIVSEPDSRRTLGDLISAADGEMYRRRRERRSDDRVQRSGV